ncbi:MAG TPA: efflux RND transporter periplasmic adaptor subunit [Rhizomicrobium sp.]|nr:efflux RND transporter periplasmic adaptor subunit [Rhizomicrobium sp.]
MSPENDQTQRRLKRAGIVAACIGAAILLLGAYVRFSEASSLKSWTREAQVPTVALISPAGGGKAQALALPGTLQAYYDAKIYAQVPGYVRAWYKDIGAHVKKGDVLAVIDTPEVDQQVAQARADLSSAISARKLSALTAARYDSLFAQGAVARQNMDVNDADLAAKTDAVKSSRANLDRLLATEAFSRIVAPFDGVVTGRTADVGMLVGSSSSGNPLFTVSDIHALRLYVDVPQSYSAQIVPGMTVTLTVPEYPGRAFPARLLSSSGAINAQTSTMLVQFEADNQSGLLKPGGYAQVSLGIPGAAAMLRLPASALMFRAAGLQVATLGPQGRIVMKPITIGTDLGTAVIVASGLSPRDRVVNNPPDSLSNGDKVRVTADGN